MSVASLWGYNSRWTSGLHEAERAGVLGADGIG